jgi:acyl phosphate:glycerol-3-phosphate acyltransferase
LRLVGDPGAPATAGPGARTGRRQRVREWAQPVDLYSAGVDDLPLTILLLAMGYLSGSLPMGVIVARATGGTDPRTVGSGRTGGTNMLRAGGWGRAIAVAVLDLSKGLVPILIARVAGASVEVQALTGLAAVLGSWKSVFLGFHGGRGVATGVGGMIAIAPWIIPLALPAFILIIWVTRYVSLGSILGTAFGMVIVILAVIGGWLDPGWLLYVIPGEAIVWYAHRDNIARLLAGTERKFDPGDRTPSAPPGSPEPPTRGGTPAG